MVTSCAVGVLKQSKANLYLSSFRPAVGLNRLSPICAEIMPRWIGRDNELQFANAQPALELFLASDRRSNGREPLEVNKLVDVVFGGVACRILLLFMLPNPDFEFRSNADVELLEAIREYINIGVSLHEAPLFLFQFRSHRRHPERSEGSLYLAFVCS